MTWILLQSESPWQRVMCFSVPGVFLRNRLTEYVPAIIASIEAKFEQILRAFSKYLHN